jgi:hypothetical protein
MTIGTLTPAYGRDYRSKAAVEAALLAGHDFVLNMGPRGSGYANLETLQRMGVQRINVRYGKLRKVAVLDVPPADGGAR